MGGHRFHCRTTQFKKQNFHPCSSKEIDEICTHFMATEATCKASQVADHLNKIWMLHGLPNQNVTGIPNLLLKFKQNYS